jgi:hypothetical protein
MGVVIGLLLGIPVGSAAMYLALKLKEMESKNGQQN